MRWRALKRQALVGCVAQIRHGLLHRALSAWQAKAAYQRDVRHRCSACLAKLQSASACRAFNSWRDWGQHKHELRWAPCLSKTSRSTQPFRG